MVGSTFQRGNNRAAKLTGEQVIEIRERYATERGLSQPMLARDYGVSINTIAKVLNGTSWTYLLRGEEPQVYRPPIQARASVPTEEQVNDSANKLTELLAEQPQRANSTVPSLYDSPPPTLNEDQAAGRLGLARLSKELDGPGPLRQQEIAASLAELDQDVLKITLIDKPKGD